MELAIFVGEEEDSAFFEMRNGCTLADDFVSFTTAGIYEDAGGARQTIPTTELTGSEDAMTKIGWLDVVDVQQSCVLRHCYPSSHRARDR